ncbi:bifunctional tetrahydrofolate synthase/dihydrofolate synthase [Alkanindiges illinoisensis]|uniref:Dihydrofolate synthase/folylpolyglutamate synthase n=1 Tax=Alkanindiges illinoisensis TaxID=197183 RepID=A0A4Y7X9Y7_9GAMM|nr:bifunctional tetrahydrofolate synthase/dihydrofolate synthase [Alkanindiges illinoisensis]TEU24710.1 bifunctional tetrahydrofolate synthase/dihydrofolate synthase [Alkanindiges illinoisensis]
MNTENTATIAPTITSSLQQWLDYWSSIHVTAIDLGLERIRPVAEYLHLLKPLAHVVTVAGTNGKGSTTTTIAAIYQAAGYQVGLYQSPHIYRFNERIKKNGAEAEDATLIAAFVAVEQARVACQLTLSFFEATTLAAFWIFQQQACDIWVLEVGLGGRLDAVNLIDPHVAVITNIGLDHVEWLGNSIEKIAFEKAGIMRTAIPVIYAEPAGQGPESNPVPQAIIERSQQLNCPLYVAGRDYSWQTTDDTFYYASPSCTLALPIPKLAPVNVAAAISAVLLGTPSVNQAAIIHGVNAAYIAGRFEVRQFQDRTLILDVAHNVHGVQFLLHQLQSHQQQLSAKGMNDKTPKIHLVFSMLADKDMAGVANLLKPVVAHWYIAALDNERAASLTQLRHAITGLEAVQQSPESQDQAQPVSEHATITAAFSAALNHSQPQDIIMVCGSFYTLEAVWESLATWQ